MMVAYHETLLSTAYRSLGKTAWKEIILENVKRLYIGNV